MKFEEQFSNRKSMPFRRLVFGLLPRRPQDAPRRPRDAQRRAQDAPKMLQERAKAPPRRTKTPQDVTRRPDNAPKTPPRRPKKQEKTSPRSAPKRNPLQTLISNRFEMDFGVSFVGFWRFLGSIFDGFELHVLKNTPQEKQQKTRRAPRAKGAE